MADKRLECDPLEFDDFEAAMRQMMASKPETKGENREPTRAELSQEFKLVRRK